MSASTSATQAATGPAPRTGIFGGTFNPIHLGHLRAAEEVRQALGLARVLFVPSRIPPHKQADPDDPIAEAGRRLRWVERAIAGNPAFEVDRIELEREGPSYLVDTLRAIRRRAPDPDHAAPVFIVGQDAFAEMGDWRSPEALFELADLAVMTRPPGPLRHLADRLPAVVKDAYEIADDGTSARHLEAGTRIDLVPVTALDISSSRVREECRAGRSIRYLVPDSLRDEIVESRCYAPTTSARAGA